MSSEREGAPTGARIRTKRSAGWLLLPVCAGVTVFLVNNLLLARLLTSLPGGTMLAPTTTAALAWVALRVRRPGAVTLVYATYALLAILGHLGVDAGSYVTHLPRVLGAALAFDLTLVLGRFRRGALLLGLLPCAGILLVGSALSARATLVALLLAAAGLVAGAAAHGYGKSGSAPRR